MRTIMAAAYQPKPEVVHVRVCGKVQGVGYRRWLHKKATSKGIQGWVRNVADGSVEALLAGPASAVEETLESMRVGPARASVDFVRARPLDAPPKPVNGFEVRKSTDDSPPGARGKKADKLFAKVHEQLITRNSKNPLSLTLEGERYWQQGFLADKIRLYDTSRYELRSYLSDIQREMTKLINGAAQWTLNDKLGFELAFGDVLRTPSAELLVEMGYVWCRHDGGVVPPGKYFAKPVFGGGGGGVFSVSFDGRTVKFRGRKALWPEFVEHLRSLKKGYLLCRKVEQHDKLARIYPGSTNTIRVLMCRELETSAPIVAAAVLRVGSDSSKGVDNFSRGGTSFAVDISSGTIGLGFTKRDGRSRPYERHPSTDYLVTGERIPFWQETLSTLETTFRQSKLRYVGWDVIVTEAGPVVLEGNNYSDVHLLQVHRPLLTDQRIEAFYRHYNVLDWNVRPT